MIREGPRVERERFDDLAAALEALEARGQEIADGAAPRDVKSPLGRDYKPVQQVRARLELRGRGVSAGVDVRGDGSSEAFTGRLRRALVKQRPRETAYEALRRTLRGR